MSLAEQLIRWRRELHQYPELSLQEVDTTARIRDWLQSGGISLLPYELKTGAVAEVGSGDKVIALRADIDALPIEEAASVPFRSLNAGVMHACGHDIHTSVILGAALLLKQREAQLAGRVRILFQPAEELRRRENPDSRRGTGGFPPFSVCIMNRGCRWGIRHPRRRVLCQRRSLCV